MTSGRLRAQIGPAVGQPPAGQLESRVAAQPVEVVSILIAAGNGEDARAQDVGQEMSDLVLIAPVRNYLGEPLGDAEPTLRLGEQHDAAIRRRVARPGGDTLRAPHPDREALSCMRATPQKPSKS